MVEAAFAARKPMKKKRREGQCELCGATFQAYGSRQRFCSKSCAAKRRMGPEAKAERFRQLLAKSPTRRVGSYLVYVPETGRKPFVLAKRVDGRLKARQIEFRFCKRCGREYVWLEGARKDQESCSRQCSGVVHKRKMRQRTAQRGGPKMDAIDSLFSKIIRSPGACRRCGSTDRLQCAHIVSRRYHGVRFDEGNAMCLCAACHMYFTHRPLEWEIYIGEQYGSAYLLELKRRALAFSGPLDRIAIYARLCERADELGIDGKRYVRGAGFEAWGRVESA